MIRKANRDDWPSISEVSRRSGYEDYINEIGISYLDEGEVIVFEEEKIKAFAKMEFLPDNAIWFSGMRVDPDYWRSGIGFKLTEYSLKYAVERKCTTARLLVFDDNFRSLNLVEKMGFRKIQKYRFIRGVPDLKDFDQQEYLVNQGLFNQNWVFIDASKTPGINSVLNKRDRWKIIKGESMTFEILSTGDGKIFLDGNGFTCAKDSVDLSGSIYGYDELSVTSGYILEKTLPE